MLFAGEVGIGMEPYMGFRLVVHEVIDRLDVVEDTNSLRFLRHGWRGAPPNITIIQATRVARPSGCITIPEIGVRYTRKKQTRK